MKHNTSVKNTGYNTRAIEVENFEGDTNYQFSDPRAKLVHLVSSCMMNEAKFYGNVGDTEKLIMETCEEVAKTNPKFILQLAEYTRKEMYLRSVSVFLLAKAANMSETKPFVKEYAPRIIQRADEINETIACYINVFGNGSKAGFPNALKKGIAKAFENFDEYQFAKYNRKSDAVKFKDSIMITHPTAPSELIEKILEKNDKKLEIPYTWETKLSESGNTKEVWEELIDSQKVGYMALLRNLRNILNADVSKEHIKKVTDYLSNEKAVKNSKQFPFRFFSAYREIQSNDNKHTVLILDALEDAIEISYANIPYMKGTTVLACDVSGSMQQPVSGRSKMELFDIGLLMGSATNKYTDEAIIGMFGDIWKPINLRPRNGIINNTMEMHRREGEVGYSTNGYLVIEDLINKQEKVDRVLIFTDCQMWNRYGETGRIQKLWAEYRKTNPNAKLYLFNLNGYGTTTFPDEDPSVCNISGWSDKVLKFIEANETNKNTQVEYIQKTY